MRRRGAPFVAVMTLGVIGWLLVPSDQTCRFAAWWDDEWRVRQLIEVRAIDHLAVNNVPFTVRIGPEHDVFWAAVGVGGRDVRAVDCRGRLLPLEIERFDAEARELILWVDVPAIGPAADNRFLLYVGGPARKHRPPSMWSDGYGVVLHMMPGYTHGALRNSAPPEHHVRLNDYEAPVWAPGIQAHGLHLTRDRFIDVLLATPWALGADAWTIEAWLDIPEPALVLPRWLVWTSPSPAAVFGVYLHPTRSLVMELQSDGIVADHSFLAFAPRGGRWSHSALVRSGNQLTVYLNGLQETTTLSTAAPIADIASALRIGAGADGRSDLLIDEWRLSPHVARSATWLQASRLAATGAYAFGWLESR